MRTKTIAGILLVAFFCSSFAFAKQTKPVELTLPEVVKKTLQLYFSQLDKKASYQQWAKTLPVAPRYRRQAGVFVTLSRNGKSRACWGGLTPRQPDLVKETVYATLDALTKEYRYRPITKTEWPSLKAQVTIVKGIESISSYRQLSPLRDGLLLRSGTRSAVILPGEATDAYYEWVMARTKAGIPKNAPQQLYKLSVEIED